MEEITMHHTAAAHTRGPRNAIARPGRRDARKRARRLGAVETTILGLVAVMLALTLVWQFSASYSAEIDRTAVISVSASDTLWEIARDHPLEGMTTAETVDAIRTLNDMEGASLMAGQRLVVPAPDLGEDAVAMR
jgi:hypothetical protein